MIGYESDQVVNFRKTEGFVIVSRIPITIRPLASSKAKLSCLTETSLATQLKLTSL